MRTYDTDGSFLSEHPAQDGVVVARLPIGTWTVEAVTHAGISLGRVGLVRHGAVRRVTPTARGLPARP